MARLNADRASPGLGERCRATAWQIVAQAGKARFWSRTSAVHKTRTAGPVRAGCGATGRRRPPGRLRAAGSSTLVHRDTPCDAKPRLL